MSAYNFRLHDMVIDALNKAIVDHTENMVCDPDNRSRQVAYRKGFIWGLREALAVAEETRKKALKE